MTTKQLHFKWTISKGRDTYGYNIVTLLVDGDKVGSCNGGGYDMQGTVFAQWLTEAYQDRLLELFEEEIKQFKNEPLREGYSTKWKSLEYPYYGATLSENKKGEISVRLDGACGFSSIERIANAIGIKLKWNKESARYRNHTYYTALIEEPSPKLVTAYP